MCVLGVCASLHRSLVPQPDEQLTFYGDVDDDDGGTNVPSRPPLDHDHRLLLRNTRPLLQSRNAAVSIPATAAEHKRGGQYLSPCCRAGIRRSVSKALLQSRNAAVSIPATAEEQERGSQYLDSLMFLVLFFNY